MGAKQRAEREWWARCDAQETRGVPRTTPCPGRKAFLTLPSGTHRNPFMSPADPDFKLVAESTTDFLRWRLNGDADARKRLAEVGTNFDDRLG